MLQTEWGIPKFIDLATFKDPLKGYLKNDTCVFGAEVFIVNPTSKGEYLSFIHEPMTSSFKWNFEDFSDASCEKYNSEIFVAGNHKWYIYSCILLPSLNTQYIYIYMIIYTRSHLIVRYESHVG